MTAPGAAAGSVGLGRPELVRLLALSALVAVTVAVGYLVNAWVDPVAVLRDWVNRAGTAGPAIFVVAFLALNTLGVPLPVLGAAAGVAFGPVPGAATVLAAMTVTACVQFLLARHIIGARVQQRLGGASVRVKEVLERRGVLAVAAARLLPGPFSEVNMLAGLTLLTLRDFTIGTIIGCVPKALVWSGLGAFLF